MDVRKLSNSGTPQSRENFILNVKKAKLTKSKTSLDKKPKNLLADKKSVMRDSNFLSNSRMIFEEKMYESENVKIVNMLRTIISQKINEDLMSNSKDILNDHSIDSEIPLKPKKRITSHFSRQRLPALSKEESVVETSHKLLSEAIQNGNHHN